VSYRSATLEVLAEDDHLHSSPVQARVHVSVRDVNDNAPVVELMPSTSMTSDRDVTWWQLNVTEHASNGTFVGHVTVSDADDAGRQRVSCLLRGVDNQHTVRDVLVHRVFFSVQLCTDCAVVKKLCSCKQKCVQL